MSGQSFQDPLEYFHPQTLFRTSSEEDDVIESAKKAINTANREALTPETYTKYQNQLKEIIDTSPNKVATASYLLERISESWVIGRPARWNEWRPPVVNHANFRGRDPVELRVELNNKDV